MEGRSRWEGEHIVLTTTSISDKARHDNLFVIQRKMLIPYKLVLEILCTMKDFASACLSASLLLSS